MQDAYKFFHDSDHARTVTAPDMDSVVKYFENRAPTELTFDPQDVSPSSPLVWGRVNHFVPKQATPCVTHVNLVRFKHAAHRTPGKKLDVLCCDMHSGWVTVVKPYDHASSFVVGKLKHPVHAEVVDLDGDGIDDVIVAELGSQHQTSDRIGKVVWFKGQADASFTPHTLLQDVGRVTDVQAADFNGDGKLDLIVAVFGGRKVGEVVLLENRTTDWRAPHFVAQVVDDRHGAIHVPVADLNGDGKPDFVALISQEHETIVAFLNDGTGPDGKVKFRKEVIFQGPHPSWGSTGIQLVDMNGDGKLDVLYTNGDVMDTGPKPWHSVQWLENQGKYPFQRNELTKLPGAIRALAADLEGRGLLDVVALSFVAANDTFHDSIILLRQEKPGQFVRYHLEQKNHAHVSFAIGDLDGDGKQQIVIGNLFLLEMERVQSIPALNVWKNPACQGEQVKIKGGPFEGPRCPSDSEHVEYLRWRRQNGEP